MRLACLSAFGFLYSNFPLICIIAERKGLWSSHELWLLQEWTLQLMLQDSFHYNPLFSHPCDFFQGGWERGRIFIWAKIFHGLTQPKEIFQKWNIFTNVSIYFWVIVFGKYCSFLLQLLLMHKMFQVWMVIKTSVITCHLCQEFHLSKI